MTNTNLKKQEEKQSGLNPVAVAVTGAVVGAGIAIAGVVALKDEKNREKVKEALTNVKDRAENYIEDVQKQARDKKDEIEEKIAEGTVKIEKAANAAKDSLNSSRKDIV